MQISVIGLYVDQLISYINRGVVGRYINNQHLTLKGISLRDFADPPHYKVDAYPYANRKGMLLRSDVLHRAIQSVPHHPLIIIPDPIGEPFDFNVAKSLSKQSHLLFVSPAYEGVDDRIFQMASIRRYSVGDFIVPNGDTPVALMIEAIVRYLPGVLGRDDCVEDDSILSGLLESPQYCAPRSIDQIDVPDVLLSGHHQEIDRWKQHQSLRRTLYKRPDLLNRFSFSKTLVKMIDQIILEDTQ